MTQLTVDGRQLSGTDRFGDWQVGNVEGLFDTPDRKQDNDSRPLADGDYDAPEFYERRDITIEGRLIAANHDMMHEGINWLKSMLANRAGTMFIRGHGPEQWASVKLSGAVRCRVETDTYMTWQLRLKSIDPYLYGAERKSTAAPGTSAHVFHRGSVDAWPVVTVSGSIPMGYTLTMGGKTVEVLAALTSGAPHVIDMKARRLTVGGVWVYGLMESTNYPSVLPGPRQTFSLAPFESGTGTATAVFHDTYI